MTRCRSVQTARSGQCCAEGNFYPTTLTNFIPSLLRRQGRGEEGRGEGGRTAQRCPTCIGDGADDDWPDELGEDGSAGAPYGSGVAGAVGSKGVGLPGPPALAEVGVAAPSASPGLPGERCCRMRRAAETEAQCTAASYAPAPCSVSSDPVDINPTRNEHSQQRVCATADRNLVDHNTAAMSVSHHWLPSPTLHPRKTPKQRPFQAA